MVAVCATESDARRRRLEELFEDQPFLSPTMKASRLHEREQPGGATMNRQWPDLVPPRATAKPKVSSPLSGTDTTVRRLGFIVSVRRDPDGVRTELKPDDAPDVMCASEAARFLRVGQGTLRRLVKEQGLPCSVIGRSRRFRRTAMLRWLKSQEARR